MIEVLSYVIPVLSLIVMLIGLFGLVMPIFPGGVVIWLAALAYGVLSPGHFDGPGKTVFAVITVLMLLSAAADNVMMGAKAKEAGASWRGIILALASGVVFSLLFTPIVGLIVAPLALYFTEYQRLVKLEKPAEEARSEAKLITKGLVVGCGWAFFIRFGLGILKIGLWSYWAWSYWA